AECSLPAGPADFEYRRASLESVTGSSYVLLLLLAWLSDDIDQCRLTAFHSRESPLDGRTEILGIGDRAFTVPAHALRHLGIVDVRILDGRSDSCAFDPAIVPVPHTLQVHDLLMVGAIIVHHGQHWNPMVRGGPQHAGSVHQITIILDIHGQPAVLFVRKRGADGGRRAVSHAGSAGATDV